MVSSGASPHADDVVGPSDRSFGLTFGILFLVIAAAPLWGGAPMRPWALGLSALCIALAVGRPRLLAPANRLWLRIGLVMHRVVNPVVMAALFYLVVTPFGLVMRLTRREFVRTLRPDPAASTYWIPRRRDASSSMDRQF